MRRRTPFPSRSPAAGEYDESLLEQRLAESPLFQNMTDSVDAEIAYDEATDQYVLHPETLGTRVDLEQVFTLAKEAVGTLHTTLSLEEAGCYDSVKQADAAMEQAVETMNLYNKARISYTFGDETETLDPATVREAIVCDENSQVSLNTELLQAWVEGLAEAHDTVGTSRSFRSTSSGPGDGQRRQLWMEAGSGGNPGPGDGGHPVRQHGHRGSGVLPEREGPGKHGYWRHLHRGGFDQPDAVLL